METLYHLVIAAQKGDTCAVNQIVNNFKPLLIKVATKYGYYDEDCYQECVVALISSISRFEFRDN